MANILFVAFDYPPVLTPESVQSQRRALTLAENGHKVYVLTAHINPRFEYIDDTFFLNHKNIDIVRTGKPFLERPKNIFQKYLDLADRKAWWRDYGYVAAMKIIEKNTIDTLYSHSNPLVTLLVGKKVKENHDSINWVAHFSDPWTLNPYKKYRFGWQKSINKRLENQVLTLADKITVTSDRTKKLFLDNFSVDRAKFFVLPHVYDASLYNDSVVFHEKKVVVHTGNIYGLRTMRHFIEALNSIRPKNIEFRFYGKIKASEAKMVELYNLEGIIKLYPQIPYLKSIEAISCADYLLLIDAPLENSPFFPSKLADYIGANKPIVALTKKESATVDVLKNICNDRYIAEVDDVEDIKRVIGDLGGECVKNQNMSHYDMNNYKLLKEVFEE